jgi:phage terminase large subunit
MTSVTPAPDNSAFSRYGGFAIADNGDRLGGLSKYGGFEVPKPAERELQFLEAFEPLFRPSRYKILEGGRASAKSWAVARALIIRSLRSKIRILCAREYQTTIADSVHKLLRDQIEAMGLSPWFKTTANLIRTQNGSEFIFVGLGDLSLNIYRTRIKSFEAVDICWLEEAEGITDRSWEILIPTIRKAGSEIWVVYNPNLETDSTYQRFHLDPPGGLDPTSPDFYNSRGEPKCIRIVTNWRDNVWMSEELMIDKDHLFRNDPESAAHVWDGQLRQHAEATIFRHKYRVHDFTRPEGITPLFGADWGFSQDPTTLMQIYITGTGVDSELWIENEAWGIEVDFATNDPKKIPLVQDLSNPSSRKGLFEKVPEARNHKIFGDCSQPGIISFVRGIGGYNIVGAEKWDGSVLDGISYLRGFKQIHVHKTNCPHAATEFDTYSWIINRTSGEITDVPADKNNHCIAEGELVTTPGGVVPIEDVRPGMEVLTRFGFERVNKAWLAGEDREIWKLRAGGRTLYATPDHEVWTTRRGFVRMDELRYTDEVLVEGLCAEKQSNTSQFGTREGNGGDTPMLKGKARAATLKTVASGFTALFGSKQMERSRLGIIFITKMQMWTITIWEILNAFHLPRTGAGIQTSQKGESGDKSILQSFAPLQKFGMLLREVGSGIGVMLSQISLGQLSLVPTSANIAIAGLPAQSMPRVPNFARMPASLPLGENRGQTTLSDSAKPVKSHSSPTNTTSERLVPARVEVICAATRTSRVYDLEVANHHEFVVSGIVVSNCIDAIRYALNGYIQRRGSVGTWGKLGRAMPGNRS